MKFSLLEKDADKRGQDLLTGQAAADTRGNHAVIANDSEAIQSLASGQAQKDADSTQIHAEEKTGVGPLNNEPKRISLLSHFTFTFLIIALVSGAIAGAGWYFRDSALADTVINKYLDHQVTSGLVGHWTFDGQMTSSTTAYDSSPTHATGTLTNRPKRVVGKLGQGLWFHDEDFVNRHVNAGSPNSLDDINRITITAWIMPGTSNGDGLLVSKHTSKMWLKLASDSTLQWYQLFSSVPGFWSSPTPLRMDEWQFISITYDSSSTSNEPLMYLNGESLLVTETINPSGTRTSEASDNLTIGGSSAGAIFDGTLDDVRIYNRVLSQKEITRLYKLGEGVKVNVTPTTSEFSDGLIGHWTFDGQMTSSTTAYDSSPTHATGTLTNGPARVQGKLGQGLQFDGVDDYVSVVNGGGLGSLQTGTIALWVKWIGTQSCGNSCGAVVARQRDTFFTNQMISLNGSNPATAVVLWAPYVWNTYAITGSTAVGDGKWRHIAITYTSGSHSLYVDGILDGTGNTGGGITDYDVVLSLGAWIGDGNSYSRSQIDDVRIYNRILSADEIANLYSGTKGSRVGKCGDGPILDADGNKYGIVEIGTQCWLDRNMNVGTRINAGIGNQTNNATIEKYCYSDTVSNCINNHPKRPDGGFYEWDEAMQYVTTEGARGICPAGWHIPTDAEWYTLENFLKASSTASCDATRTIYACVDAGTKLKFGGSTGFEGNLSGIESNGGFGSRDTVSFFWTSSEDTSFGQDRRLTSSQAKVGRGSSGKINTAVSVRCIKD